MEYKCIKTGLRVKGIIYIIQNLNKIVPKMAKFSRNVCFHLFFRL